MLWRGDCDKQTNKNKIDRKKAEILIVFQYLTYTF